MRTEESYPDYLSDYNENVDCVKNEILGSSPETYTRTVLKFPLIIAVTSEHRKREHLV